MAGSVLVGYTGCLWSVKGTEVVGMKGVGKDTVAGYVQKEALQADWDVVTLSFADPLKDLVALVYGLDRDTYDRPGMKEQPLIQYPGWTYRRFLETVGTEVGRYFQPDLWTEQLCERVQREAASPWSMIKVPEEQVLARCQEVGLPLPAKRRKLIQVTDVRFKNEYDRLKSLGAQIVQVNRRTAQEGVTAGHVSNQFNPSLVPDIVVNNYGSWADLAQQIPTLFRALSEAQ